MRFYKVDMLLSENFKEFLELLEYTEDKADGKLYDPYEDEYEYIEDCDVTKELKRLWRMVHLEGDDLTQRVMTHLLENDGWYDPEIF